jgi:hypothetical protein
MGGAEGCGHNHRDSVGWLDLIRRDGAWLVQVIHTLPTISKYKSFGRLAGVQKSSPPWVSWFWTFYPQWNVQRGSLPCFAQFRGWPLGFEKKTNTPMKGSTEPAVWTNADNVITRLQTLHIVKATSPTSKFLLKLLDPTHSFIRVYQENYHLINDSLAS